MRRLPLLFATAAALLAASSSPSAQEGDNRPNVLFIVVDDLNDWVGALGGHPDVRTPKLDFLMQGGTVFTNAHAAVSNDASRIAALTGRHPTTTGIYGRKQKMREVLPEVLTLPQQLLLSGYECNGYGKIFQDPDAASWSENVYKFRQPTPTYETLPSAPEQVGSLSWGPYVCSDEEMYDTRNVTFAVEFMKRGSIKPFFLSVGIFAPKPPWRVPKGYFEGVPPGVVGLPEVRADDLEDVPEAGREKARSQQHAAMLEAGAWEEAVRAYQASLGFVDQQISALMGGLVENGLLENTIIVLWGDSGFHFGEKEHWSRGTLWEDATHVPLLVRVPKMAPARCDRPVELTSIYATLAELCGVELDFEPDGPSLVPLLADPEAEWGHVALTSLSPDDHAVRTQRWRYIRYADGSEELYDHDADPHEWTNLAARPESAEVLEELRTHLPE